MHKTNTNNSFYTQNVSNNYSGHPYWLEVNSNHAVKN